MGKRSRLRLIYSADKSHLVDDIQHIESGFRSSIPYLREVPKGRSNWRHVDCEEVFGYKMALTAKQKVEFLGGIFR